MRIAMIGTRGVPARYGGFETAVEEVGQRLVKMGHEIVVYCRGNNPESTYLGMQRVPLRSLRRPTLETLSHTALSVVHLLRNPVDVVILFNAANAPLLPFIRAAGTPVAVHVDGLEWKRAKWGPNGRRYYLANERLAVKLGDAIIADAIAIQEYYRDEYGAESTFIPYGAPIQYDCNRALLERLQLQAGAFHLVVARLEPENNVDKIIEGYTGSGAELPLVVVGSVPYPSAHELKIRELAARDPRVRLVGGLWDQAELDALYAGARTYLHGHSVGGTNPSLLRAMGAGANVIALDVPFAREVLAETGEYFARPTDLAALLEFAEENLEATLTRGAMARARAITHYRWDDVAAGYEQLCHDLRSRSAKRAKRQEPNRVPRPKADSG
jgi:glycosyltransferase involved in cell wall biosynthesis